MEMNFPFQIHEESVNKLEVCEIISQLIYHD